MNSNTFGEDGIPEAIEDLAGSLDAPDPAAIHAGLGKRQAFRRRALGGAGALVTILAIAGGALALTNDTTTTATAADDSVEEPEGLIFEWEGSVADDSPPDMVFEPLIPVPVPGEAVIETIELSAVITIRECANTSTVSVGGHRWLAWDLPSEWQDQDLVPVDVVITGTTMVATDSDGLSAPFSRLDELSDTSALSLIEAERRGCAPFEDGVVTPLAEGSTTTTTTIVVELPPTPGPDAVLATSGDVDGVPGDEQIWLDPDGTLHTGDLVGYADYWDIDQYWFDEQAQLEVVVFDEATLAIVLTLPIAEEEDPPNTVQVFFVREQGLQRVLNQTVGVYGVHPVTFDGDGAASYVQDGWTACRDSDPGDVVVRQRIMLTADGDDGELIQTSSEETNLVQDCSQLAG